MRRNSGVGTRTKRILPLAWLKRVGFNQVSNEWRLIFFSNAARIRSHGFAVAVMVAVDNDIACCVSYCEPARGPTYLRTEAKMLRIGCAEQLNTSLCNTNFLDWRAY